MMKRLVTGLLLASCMLVVCAAVAMAVAPTNVTLDLTGAVNANLTQVFKDDATYNLAVAGNNVTVHASTTQANIEPYGYGVDSVVAESTVTGTNGITATVTFTQLQVGAPYGVGGQVITGRIWSYDGSGQLVLRQSSNYAGDVLNQWGLQSNNQLQVAANGGYSLLYKLDVGNQSEYGLIQIVGSGGSASATQMNGYVNSPGFGQEGGTGCFENSSATMTGLATLLVQAHADNMLWTKNSTSTAPGTGIDYQLVISQTAGTTTITNPWVQGN